MGLQSALSHVADAVSRFSTVLEQAEFRAELDRLCRTEWRWGAPQEVRLRPLKAHKSRCTFDISVRTASGWQSVIGKVHTVDRSDVFRAMDAVRHAGFGPQAEFSIPRPLVYLSSLRVLLEEKVEGPSAVEVFLDDRSEDHVAAAGRCGQWLGRFHTAAPRLGDAADLHDQLLRLQHWTVQIKSFGEPFASKGESLLRMLEAAVPAPGTFDCSAGHGSYMPEHVLLSGRRTVTIDLDECDVADPGRDLAWFIVSLQRLGLKHRGSFHALDGAVDAFLQTYAASGRVRALAHLPFYRAAECLHRARRDLYKRIPPVREWAAIMLDEGLRAFQ